LSNALTGRFIHGKVTPISLNWRLEAGQNPTARLKVLENKKLIFFSCRESNSGYSNPSHSHYTNCATPAIRSLNSVRYACVSRLRAGLESIQCQSIAVYLAVAVTAAFRTVLAGMYLSSCSEYQLCTLYLYHKYFMCLHVCACVCVFIPI